MDDFNWVCPHCEHAVTISAGRQTQKWHTLQISNAEGQRTLVTSFIVCPNPECKKFTLTASLWESAENQHGEDSLVRHLQNWSLVPSSAAKHFPGYIPQAIRDDYEEACLIRDLSPKASATLSRRCLQGIIRDFWGAKPARLVDEIHEIRGRVDPITWDAIDAVRKLGNIGTHMEKDINVMVDVDPDEATLMIELVETLLQEWYVVGHERDARMQALVAAAAGKKP